MLSTSQDLLEQVERGNALLFVGDQIAPDAQGKGVAVHQLTMQLAARCRIDNPEEYTFPEVAQAYQDEMGRQALVQLVRDQMEILGDEPQEAHRLIARLTDCKVMATTSLDRRLERAFEEAGRPFNAIVGNVDVTFEDDRKTQLYKLRGSIERVESLVLTEDDYETFFDDQSSVSLVLQGYLARKTVLFLGYDLADPHFKRLYRKVTAPLDDYARRAYAFWVAPNESVARWCKRHSVEVIPVNTSEFLQALTKQLSARALPSPAVHPQLVEQPATPLPLPQRPYKLLDYYEAKDTAIFFGREQQIQQLTSLIHAHRLVLLHGASGTGKTSLLQAGTSPRLESADPPYEVIFIRAMEDPTLSIRRAVRRRVPLVDLPEDGPLLEFLGAATNALERILVIVLDQFEEFFIRFNPRLRAAFIAELGTIYDDRDLPVKVVFSLREDWLASMSEVEERIPEIYRTRVRLLPLSRDQAYQAVTKPVERLGMHYDPNLIERLLDDLAEENSDEPVGSTTAAVMPPQLQLVCDVLYERAQAEGRQYIMMADYEAMGRAQGILARYVESALQEHPGEEREVARGVLTALVTSQATRVWSNLKSLTSSVGAEQATVEHVLSRLTRQRLVRWVDEAQAYELTHDVLAATISGWINESDRELKQVRELLQREFADWQQDPALLPSQSKFQRINGIRDNLLVTDEEIAFLMRAAILYTEDVRYWLERVSDSDAKVSTLLEMLRSPAGEARLTAAKYLGGFSEDRAALALAHAAFEDSDSAVREMAAVTLAQMGGHAGIKQLVEIAQVSDRLQRMRAVQVLALIQDTAPGLLAEIENRLKHQTYYQLAKLRFWRNWARIRIVMVAGAIGGAMGFGLGLSPPIALHSLALYRNVVGSITDMLFIIPLLAIMGLLAGAGMALGISVGESLFSERVRLGRAVGGTVLGGLAFAAVLSPITVVDMTGLLDGVLKIVGSGLFGMATGLGFTAAWGISPKRPVALGGGMVGAVLGIMALGALGYDPFQVVPQSTVPAPVLIVSGALVGLMMAFSISWAEARWPVTVKDKPRSEAVS